MSEEIKLTMQEIKHAALPHSFTREQQRSRQHLLDALESIPQEVAHRISTANQERLAKLSLKRAKILGWDDDGHSSKRHKPSESSPEVDASTSTAVATLSEVKPHCRASDSHRDLDHFLDLPDENAIQKLHQDFLDATSNAALAQNVCASCGRCLMNNELSQQDFLSLPNSHLLSPAMPHPCHTLTGGMLLESEFVEVTNERILGWICHHCLSALKRGHIPGYSLANGMWIGPTPVELSTLTIPEQLLISLRYPRGYVFKLYPRGGKTKDHPGALQLGLKGNVTTYMTNVQAVANMLSGQLMPRKLDILPSLIAIAFIGPAKFTKTRLKSLLRVRRGLLYAALTTLKGVTQHPGYVDLEIDRAVLESMPEDDVPDEIWSTLRVEPDEKVAEHESGGYVPVACRMDEQNVDSDDDHSDNRSDNLGDNDRPEFENRSRDELYTDEELCKGVPGTEEDVDVIPLEFLGTSAADASHITPQELLKSALENLKSELQSHMFQEGGYVVRHGAFARDFGTSRSEDGIITYDKENPSCFTFPCLFPFGTGGLEAERQVRVSFVEHTRWCLQYHDRRFQKHHMFPFWAFSIQQKRQALAASKLVMRRRDFDTISASLSGLTAKDLDQAASEEEKKIPFSNPRFKVLRQFVQVTMQHVMGSDSARALNRSKIWSTSLYFNPMTLWITINPADRHDPICQIFAGKLIDMDNFDPRSGPNALERACNVANDPLAAAQFFFFLARTILEKLFGFSVTKRITPNQMGALGLGNAYFGAVEAQGRGSLHLHMIMWLRNAPNAEEMVEKLKCAEFREKIKKYIRTNLHSHIDSLDQVALDSMEPDPELAWSRPPNPNSPTYTKDLTLLEIRLAKAQQYHRCSPSTCLRYDRTTKKMACKRRAPFELSEDDIITETGGIKTKRTVPYLNTWCPTIFYGGRCNNDIKLITNGAEARSVAFYITNYATKKQGRSFNQSALLAKTYMFHTSTEQEQSIRSRKSNATFLFRCGLALNREQEYSGQQVMSYLMGFGDTIQSHTYSPIYWPAVVRELKRTFPELKSSEDFENKSTIRPKQNVAKTGSHIPYNNETDPTSSPAEEGEPEQIAVSADGTFYMRSQVIDYKFRGSELENYSFIDYFVDTYEVPISKSHPVSLGGPGRPQNQRIQYLEAHPRSSSTTRILRSAGHRNLPNIIGKWFERNDNPDTYDLHCASVLACLKPWRELHELKDSNTTWPDALSEFKETASDHHICIAANIQYYYQCQDAADGEHATPGGDGTHCYPSQRDNDDDLELSEFINNIPLSDVLLSPNQRDQMAYAERAVTIGRRLGMLESDTNYEAISQTTGPSGAMQTVSWANNERYAEILQWTNALHEMNKDKSPQHEAMPPDAGDTIQLNAMSLDSPADPTVEYTGDAVRQSLNDPNISMFSPEQLRAYMIFKSHFERSTSTSNNDNVPQLLMHIQGEGGTGKSLVITKITELLRARQQLNRLHKSAYTGIAASLIEGSTLHKLAELHIRTTTALSQTVIDRLRETWQHTRYLIIDEVSMVSKQILSSVSEMMCIAKQEAGINNNSVPFGGVNIILAGDFHQFPPVTGRGIGKGALYAPTTTSNDTKVTIGQWLYAQFTTVVILRKQYRNEDPQWQAILTRSRTGQCTSEDLQVLRSLIPTDVERNLFSRPPWTDAVLITSRCVVRDRWNEASSRSHCLRTRNRLIISHATDFYQGKPVSQSLQTRIASQEGTTRTERGGLPNTVHLAKGMPVLVTSNIETEIDVANGSRGVVEDIILHSDETETEGNSLELHLKRPPACVLVRLLRTRATPIPGLPQGVIPITPIQGRLQLKISKGKKISLRREQIPLIPAYAFTDYRAQGQTIPYVIIDISRPPTGGITPFNAYVALSRSRSRDQCRLLRDFEDSLFTVPPSAALLEEDRRLEELDRLTKLEYEQHVEN